MVKENLMIKLFCIKCNKEMDIPVEYLKVEKPKVNCSNCGYNFIFEDMGDDYDGN